MATYRISTRSATGRDELLSLMKEKFNIAMKEVRLNRGEFSDLKDRVKCLEEVKETQAKEIEDLKEEIKGLKDENQRKERKIEELGRERGEVADDDMTHTADMATPGAGIATAKQDEMIQILQKANKELQDEVKTLAVVIEENRQKQDQITATNANIEEKLDNTVRKNEFGNQLEHHARNVEAIANMDKEIIAFGVEEKEESDFTVRKGNDRAMVIKILKTIDSQWNENGLVDHRRIGKYTPGAKPRPLKITLGSNQQATNFIQQAKTLKDHTEMKEIGIRKSLCKTDRETLKAAVQEMKRNNNERTPEERELFFWSIRSLKATKIMKHPTQTGTEGNRQAASTYQ